MNQSTPISGIDLVFPILPPAHDGIGDYTAFFATELAKLVPVRILTSSDVEIDAILGVGVVPCFKLSGKGRFQQLRKELASSPSNVTILQYNPFSWGKRGWAPDLINCWKSVASKYPERIWASMFHETYMLNKGWRASIMRSYQKWQYNRLTGISQINFYATEAWMHNRFVSLTNRSKSVSLPVGASMQPAICNPLVKRASLGIPRDSFVLGSFGSAHVSKNLEWVRLATKQIKMIVQDRPVFFVHVGEEIDAWRNLDIPHIQVGRQPAPEASAVIACMDLMLAPFMDGLTTRRSSVMAALVNGVPVASTRSDNTDSLLKGRESDGIYLSKINVDAWGQMLAHAVSSVLPHREMLRGRLSEYYREHFSWRTIAQKTIGVLQKSFCGKL